MLSHTNYTVKMGLYYWPLYTVTSNKVPSSMTLFEIDMVMFLIEHSKNAIGHGKVQEMCTYTKWPRARASSYMF